MDVWMYGTHRFCFKNFLIRVTWFLIGLERQSGVGVLCGGVIFKDSGTARGINERREKP